MHDSCLSRMELAGEGSEVFWPLTEAYSGGVLSGISINKTYNSALQPETLGVQGLSSCAIQTTYGYLNSRLRTVTHFGNIATYSYWPTSSLVSSIVFNNGTADKMTESRAYDGFNRLTERKTVAGASTVADYDYAYNLANQRTRIDISGTSPSYVSIDYDNLGQVTNAVKYWASDSLPVVGQQLGYQFNDIGNRKSTVRDGRVAEYANNNVNQITGRTVPGYLNVIGEADSASTVKVNSKTVERKGTYYRKELQVPNATPLWVGITNVAIKPNGSAENYVTNLGSVYVPPANESFTYDGDGNLTSDGLWNYTWDGENRLLKVESRTTVAPAARYKVEWIYDALGRRVSESAYNWNTGTGAYVLNTTVLFVYDGWQCIGELTTSKAVQRTYAWGLDMSGTLTGAGGVGGLLMIKSTGVGSHFYSYDGNGNVVNLVSATDGTESARYEYDSFGIILRATGTMALVNPYRFSTKRQEAKTDLILYEYRPYSPSLGRWLSRDTIGEKGGLNLYGFVGGNPINRFDVLGLYEDPREQRCCICMVSASLKNNNAQLYSLLKNNIKFTAPDDRPENAKYEGDVYWAIARLGRQGGKLGFAFAARAACGASFSINFTFDKLDSTRASFKDQAIDINPTEYYWMSFGAEGHKDNWKAFWGDFGNNNHAVLIGHEFGHLFLDIHDPYNVYAVENVIRLDMGLAKRPRYAENQADHPGFTGGDGLEWKTTGFGLPWPIPQGEWYDRLKHAISKMKDFTSFWNDDHCSQK